MFIKGFKYISKASNVEVWFFKMDFIWGELIIKRVSFMNAIPNGSNSHRIDFKNVETDGINKFLSRVLSTEYRHEPITEKQFNAYEKKFIDWFRTVSQSITGVTWAASWTNWIKE